MTPRTAGHGVGSDGFTETRRRRACLIDMQVVEVIARIGDSVVDVQHVPSTGRYRIGTGSGVELPVAAGALRVFPVLDEGAMFRRPAGVQALLHSASGSTWIAESELRLQPGWRVELALGQVVLSLALVAAPSIALPRRKAELRPWLYGIAVLAVHLLVWGAAMVLEPFEQLAVETEATLAPRIRVTHVEEPPKPLPEPKQIAKQAREAQQAGAAGPRQPELPTDPAQRAAVEARGKGVLGAKGLSDLSMLVPSVDVRKLVGESTFYDEQAAQQKLFGGGPRFDPGKKEGWGTVRSGRYATVSQGRGAGDEYALPGESIHMQPNIVLCASGACRVDGAIDREVVNHQIDLRTGYIGNCYQRLARRQLSGVLVLAFTIGVDGKVHGARGSGMPEIASCAAGIIKVIPFAPSEFPTQVSYTLTFTPFQP